MSRTPEQEEFLQLLQMIFGEGPVVEMTPMTTAHYAKGQAILHRATTVPTLEEFEGLVDEVYDWHHTKEHKTVEHLHGYIHALGEGLGAIAVIRFGIPAVKALQAEIDARPTA